MSEEPIDELDARRRRWADIEAVPEPPLPAPPRPTAAEEPDDVETVDIEPTRTVYMDITSVERVPIIPPSLNGWNNIRAAVRDTLRGWLRITATLAFRSPMYTVKATGWAVVGAIRIAGRQLRWWWAADLAGTKGGSITERLALHAEVKKTQVRRGSWLAAELVALVVAVPLLGWVAPWWGLVLVLPTRPPRRHLRAIPDPTPETELPAGVRPGTGMCLDCDGEGADVEADQHSRATGHAVLLRPLLKPAVRPSERPTLARLSPSSTPTPLSRSRGSQRDSGPCLF